MNTPDRPDKFSHTDDQNLYPGLYYQTPLDHTQHGITLGWLIRMIRKKWLFILLGIALGAGFSLFKIARTPNLYQAESMIEMSVRRPRIMDRQDVIVDDRYSAFNATEIFNTRLHKFRGKSTRMHAKEVLEKQGVADANMIAAASFQLVPESYLVRITCTHPDPEWAMLSANAYTEAAILVMDEENKEVSDSAVTWLKDQAASQKKVLKGIEEELTEFRKRNNLEVRSHKKRIIENRIHSINNQLSVIDDRILKEEEVRQTLERKEIPDSYEGSDELVRQKTKLRDATTDLQELQLKYRPQHPHIITLKKKIHDLQSSLEASFDKQENNSQKTILLYEKQKKSVQSNIEKLQNEAADIEINIIDLNSRLNAIEREREVADMSYQGILRRIEEARLSADEKTAAVKISNLAKKPAFPVSPNKKKILFTGCMMGFFLGLGLAFIREWMEDYISSVEDIEHGFGLKVLGIIPQQKSKTRQELALASLNETNDHQTFSEAFVGIRTGLTVGPYADKSKSLLITSAEIECGKSVTSSNLAAAYAQAGVKTLLIDFDFRRPRLAKIFSLSLVEDQSLMHVLSNPEAGEDDFSKLAIQSSSQQLFVIGNRADKSVKASSILGNKTLSRFMQWAGKNYDQIILDSPPHSLLSDAAALSAHVEGVLLVCRHQRSHKHAIRNAVRHLDHVNADILGVIINGAPKSRGPFSSYDYYYGGYAVDEYIGSTGDDEEII